MHYRGLTGTANIVRQCVPKAARQLPGAGNSLQLLPDFHHLRDPGSAYRVAFRFQSAAGVDRMLAGPGCFAFHRDFPTLPAREKSEVFARHNLSNREAVVDFREVDIRGADARHFVSLGGRFRGGGDFGEGLPLCRAPSLACPMPAT